MTKIKVGDVVMVNENYAKYDSTLVGCWGEVINIAKRLPWPVEVLVSSEQYGKGFGDLFCEKELTPLGVSVL